MPLASALDSERCPVDDSWWQAASVVQADSEHQGCLLQATSCYRIGDAVLQIAVDDPALLDPFSRSYGECTVSTPVTGKSPRVRCLIRGDPHFPLLSVTFREGAPLDSAGSALGLLHPPLGDPPYSVRAAPLEGWWLIGGATRPVVAACDTRLLIDTERVPEDFLVEYLVSATIAAQPELLVVHGAALQLGKAGVLLAGPSRTGKTTTSVNLAARGHTLLGDEMAIIRLPTCDILPLRRSLSLRSGPWTPELSETLGRLAVWDSSTAGGKTRPLRIDELFPSSPAHPVRLRAAFFLSGFSDAPSLTPFQLTLDDATVFEYLASNDIASVSWGLTPARRTLRMLALKHVLTRLPCWRLKVGSPVETARLIERTLEKQ